MRPKPKIPTFDVLLAAIKVAPSAADLAALLVTAQTYFAGNQREELVAAVAQREAELPNGESLGR
jgi:hypothetical protein